MHVTIRPASLEDISLIQELSHEIWHEVYPSVISSEQIDYMLEIMYSNSSLEDQLITQGHSFILLEIEGKAAGFASYSIKSESEPERYRLHKLYVRPNLHGMGLGKSLVKHICHDTIQQGGTELELNVNKKNQAVSFYKHLGFQVEKEVKIDIGKGFVMDDYIMVLNLAQNSL
ncbi:MAG: GNAT family N-acetyltransferase [bacterium]